MTVNRFEKFFPTLKMSREDIEAVTLGNWEFVEGLPMPKFPIVCPQCDGRKIQLRHWTFHQRIGSKTSPHRCDVVFKCANCAFANIVFGVMVPESEFQEWMKVRQIINWRSKLEIFGLESGP